MFFIDNLKIIFYNWIITMESYLKSASFKIMPSLIKINKINMSNSVNYQSIFGKSFGVKEEMFNPYDLNSIYNNYTDFVGILNTPYFTNYRAILADYYNVGDCIKSSMIKYGKAS